MTAAATVLPSARYDHVAAIGSGLAAGLSAITVQVLWLQDDRARGNWTTPEPHRLNIAGIWHAAYFLIAASTFGVLFGLLASRISHAAGSHAVEAMLRSAGPSLTISCLLIYVVLAGHDSLAPTLAARSSLATLGAAVIAFLVLAALMLKSSFTRLVPHLALGALAACATLLSVTTSWPTDQTRVFGVVGAGLAAIGIALLSLAPGRGMTSHESYLPDRAHALLLGAILVVTLPALWARAATEVASSEWARTGAWSAAFLVTVAFSPLLILPAQRLRWLRQAADVMLVFALLSAIALVATTVSKWPEASDTATLSSFLVAAAITLCLFPILRLRMHAEVRGEQGAADASGSFALAESAGRAATATVGMLLIAGLTGGVSLTGYTLAVAIDRKYLADYRAGSTVWHLLAMGAAVVALATVLATLKVRRSIPALRFAAPVIVLAWPLAIVFSDRHDVGPVTSLAIGGGVLLALWFTNTVINNVGLFRGGQLDAILWTTTGAAAISSFATGFFAMSSALADSPGHVYSWFTGISAGTLALAVNGGLLIASGHLAAVGTGGHTRHGLTHDLIQDTALISLLYLIALIIPATTFLHLAPDLGYWGRLVATFVIVGPFLTYFLGPYQWQLRLNLGHVAREVDSRAENKVETHATIEAERGMMRRNLVILRAAMGSIEGPSQRRFLRVLNAHVRNQNAIANAIVVLSVVGFFVLLGGRTTALFAYLRRSELLDQV